jgi:parallel beta-helix repeat protein
MMIRSEKVVRVLRGVSSVAMAVLLCLGAGIGPGRIPVAEASPISCGQTLGPGGAFTLDAPLTGCSGTAVVVISAELDLNGHTVTCGSESATGIRVEGAGSRVTNGTITGCGFGVDVAGSGGHHVEKVTATDNASGFVVTTGGDNDLVQNTATDCDYGFVVQVSNNRLSGNTAKGNVVSFVINAGTGNDLSGNTANESTFGIQVSAESTAVTGNTAANNRSGFIVSAGGNELTDNVATGNNSGIIVQGGGEGNRLHSNAASGNAVVDVVDENACGRNEWQANTFGLASEACIR